MLEVGGVRAAAVQGQQRRPLHHPPTRRAYAEAFHVEEEPDIAHLHAHSRTIPIRRRAGQITTRLGRRR